MIGLPAVLEPFAERIVTEFRQQLGNNLVGIYVHGSAVLGGFNIAVSDFDFLVVAQEPLGADTKRELVGMTLRLVADAPVKGLEFSIVLRRYAQQFVSPTPFEFHYSPDWHEAFVSGTVETLMPPTDVDLAIHFFVTRERGLWIAGEPIADVFGLVPEDVYWNSLLGDAESIWADMTSNPVYSILNLCRIAAWQREKRIMSKLDGGQWALTGLDTQFHPLIQQAMTVYQSTEPAHIESNPAHLEAFGAYIKGYIATGDRR